MSVQQPAQPAQPAPTTRSFSQSPSGSVDDLIKSLDTTEARRAARFGFDYGTFMDPNQPAITAAGIMRDRVAQGRDILSPGLPPATTPGQVFRRGFLAGVEGMSSDAAYFDALISTAFGNEERAERKIREAELSSLAAASNLSTFQGFDEFLEEPTFNGFFTQVVGAGGQVAPSVATTLAAVAAAALVTGATGGMAAVGGAGTLTAAGGRVVIGNAAKAGARKLVRDAFEKKARGEVLDEAEQALLQNVWSLSRMTRKAAIGGALASEYPLMSGASFGEFADAGVELDQGRALQSAAIGAPLALIGVGGEALIAKNLIDLAKRKAAREKGEGVFTRFLKEVGGATATSATTEGLTELAQEEILIRQRQSVDAEYSQEEADLRRAQALFTGFFGGGAVGGAIATPISGVRSLAGLARGDTDTTNRVVEQSGKLLTMSQEARSDATVVADTTGVGDESAAGRPTPEPLGDIQAQFDAVSDPTSSKEAMWVPESDFGATIPAMQGAADLEIVEIEPGVFAARIPGEGTVISKNRDTVVDVVRNNASPEALSRALSYSGTKPRQGDRVVRVTDRNGNVVSEELADADTEAAAVAAAEGIAGTGRQVEVVPVQQALEERRQRLVDEARQQATGPVSDEPVTRSITQDTADIEDSQERSDAVSQAEIINEQTPGFGTESAERVPAVNLKPGKQRGEVINPQKIYDPEAITDPEKRAADNRKRAASTKRLRQEALLADDGGFTLGIVDKFIDFMGTSMIGTMADQLRFARQEGLNLNFGIEFAGDRLQITHESRAQNSFLAVGSEATDNVVATVKGMNKTVPTLISITVPAKYQPPSGRNVFPVSSSGDKAGLSVFINYGRDENIRTDQALVGEGITPAQSQKQALLTALKELYSRGITVLVYPTPSAGIKTAENGIPLTDILDKPEVRAQYGYLLDQIPVKGKPIYGPQVERKNSLSTLLAVEMPRPFKADIADLRNEITPVDPDEIEQVSADTTPEQEAQEAAVQAGAFQGAQLDAAEAKQTIRRYEQVVPYKQVKQEKDYARTNRETNRKIVGPLEKAAMRQRAFYVNEDGTNPESLSAKERRAIDADINELRRLTNNDPRVMGPLEFLAATPLNELKRIQRDGTETAVPNANLLRRSLTNKLVRLYRSQRSLMNSPLFQPFVFIPQLASLDVEVTTRADGTPFTKLSGKVIIEQYVEAVPTGKPFPGKVLETRIPDTITEFEARKAVTKFLDDVRAIKAELEQGLITEEDALSRRVDAFAAIVESFTAVDEKAQQQTRATIRAVETGELTTRDISKGAAFSRAQNDKDWWTQASTVFAVIPRLDPEDRGGYETLVLIDEYLNNLDTLEQEYENVGGDPISDYYALETAIEQQTDFDTYEAGLRAAAYPRPEGIQRGEPKLFLARNYMPFEVVLDVDLTQEERRQGELSREQAARRLATFDRSGLVATPTDPTTDSVLQYDQYGTRYYRGVEDGPVNGRQRYRSREFERIRTESERPPVSIQVNGVESNKVSRAIEVARKLFKVDRAVIVYTLPALRSFLASYTEMGAKNVTLNDVLRTLKEKGDTDAVRGFEADARAIFDDFGDGIITEEQFNAEIDHLIRLHRGVGRLSGRLVQELYKALEDFAADPDRGGATVFDSNVAVVILNDKPPRNLPKNLTLPVRKDSIDLIMALVGAHELGHLYFDRLFGDVTDAVTGEINPTNPYADNYKALFDIYAKHVRDMDVGQYTLDHSGFEEFFSDQAAARIIKELQNNPLPKSKTFEAPKRPITGQMNLGSRSEAQAGLVAAEAEKGRPSTERSDRLLKQLFDEVGRTLAAVFNAVNRLFRNRFTEQQDFQSFIDDVIAADRDNRGRKTTGQDVEEKIVTRNFINKVKSKVPKATTGQIGTAFQQLRGARAAKLVRKAVFALDDMFRGLDKGDTNGPGHALARYFRARSNDPSERRGFMDRQRQREAILHNKFLSIFGFTAVTDEKEFANPEFRKAIEEAQDETKDTKDLSPLGRKVREFFLEIRDYISEGNAAAMKKSGRQAIKIKFRANYAPREWDIGKILENPALFIDNAGRLNLTPEEVTAILENWRRDSTQSVDLIEEDVDSSRVSGVATTPIEEERERYKSSSKRGYRKTLNEIFTRNAGNLGALLAELKKEYSGSDGIDRLDRANAASPEADIKDAIIAHWDYLSLEARFSVGFDPENKRILTKVPTAVARELGLLVDPYATVVGYIKSVTRRVEFEREGGMRFVTETLDRISDPQDRATAERGIEAALGKLGKGTGSITRTINSFGAIAAYLPVLTLATISGFQDVGGIAVRAQEFKQLPTLMKEVWKAMRRAPDRMALAQTVGAISNVQADITFMSIGELDFQNKTSRLILNKYFKWIGLTWWTRVSRVAAVGMGQAFLLDVAGRGELNATEQRWLSTLGVTQEDVLRWEADNKDFETEHGQRVLNAIDQFGSESVVRPDPTQRPLYGSHPYFQLLMHLKSFYYAWSKTVLGGMAREMQNRYKETGGDYSAALMPLALSAGIILPIGALGLEFREMLKYMFQMIIPGMEASKATFRTNRMDMPEYMYELINRGGYLGPFTMIDSTMTAFKYEGIAAPFTANITVFDLVDDTFWDGDVLRLFPLLNSVQPPRG